ncbi:MAG: NAD-dependent epimerase/dehydratase family protein [Flavobacteriales bacterium]|nr:NAD-dependent epimerase/dehydratase family protein [Flavobacteriales bacterium]
MVLVTGATGIVGSHILIELLKAGTDARILIRKGADRTAIETLCRHSSIVIPETHYTEGDILDPISLESAIRGCTEVYHAAAMVSFDPRQSTALFETNTIGTANVVNACLQNGVSKLCYISSTAAIGDEPIDGELTESSTWTTDKGRTAYSLSKRYAELEVMRAREEGLSTLIVNPGVVVGSGKWGESSTSIIVSSANGMRFYPSGSNGFVDAIDIARFCVQGMKDEWFKGRYLLIGENLSFKTLFTLITQSFGAAEPKIAIPRGLAQLAKQGLKFFESLRIPLFSLTSQNIDSAYRQVTYSNKKAIEKGFVFTPIEQSIQRTVELYKGRTH